MPSMRIETDALGDVSVPEEALWGAATQRALDNFAVSGRRFPKAFIVSLSRIKGAAAEVNGELGLLDAAYASAIAKAAADIAAGQFLEHFPLDIFQTGSGTSTNMNANEVIANLANAQLGGHRGAWAPIHPNDHVNRCQSSNDVIPSALHVAAALDITERLLPALARLRMALSEKAQAFDHIVKIGRTHLMDAMPVRLGQEFFGWERQVEKGVARISHALAALHELALGGSAVGTGFGTHSEFAARVCAHLASETGLPFHPAANSFEALASHSPCAEVSGALQATAGSLVRIADDLRLLASGPRLGLGEMVLPALQPGSSMMPGKVNPVIPEMVVQVGTQILANHTAIAVACQGGHLELNTQLPVIASNLLESIEILANAATLFAKRCIEGIRPNEAACQRNIEQSLSLATALVPAIGYERAAELAHEAARSGKTIREVALERQIAAEEELDRLLDVRAMTL